MRILNLMTMATAVLMVKHDAKAGGSADPTPPPTEPVPPVPPPVAPPTFNAETGETDIPTGLSAEVKLLKKLVAKDIVGRARLVYRKKFLKDAEGKETNAFEPLLPAPLYVVFGQARDTRTGESDFGPWVAFLGHFEAIDLETGERYVSDKLHLQDPAEGLLIDQMAKRATPSDTIGFMFEVGKKVSQKWMDTDNGNSYEFTIKTHFQIDKADPLADMRRLALKSGTLASALKRLAAPK